MPASAAAMSRAFLTLLFALLLTLRLPAGRGGCPASSVAVALPPDPALLNGYELRKVMELAGVRPDLDRRDTLDRGQLLERQALHRDGEDAHRAALQVAQPQVVARGVRTAKHNGVRRDRAGRVARRLMDD